MRLPNSLRGTLNYSPLATLFALSETTGGDFRDALDVEHSILRQKPQPYDVRCEHLLFRASLKDR